MTELILAASLVATNLPTVVVEASRLDKTPRDLPQNVQVISANEIAHSGAYDVAGVLSKLAPQVHLSHLGGNNPALTQLSMGGYGENGFGRLLVLVDGEKLNNPDMSTPNLAQVSLASVKQIEVLSGPQTVLHGDGASAGMINIVTEPTDYENHGAVELHGGSWNTIGGSLAYRGGLKDEGLLYWASAAYDHSDGYRENSGFDIWNVNGGIRKNWDNGSWLRVSAFYNDSDYELPGYISRDQWHTDPRMSTAIDDYYRRTTEGLNATVNLQLNDENAIKVANTFSKRHMQSHSISYGMSMDYDYQIYSYEVTPQWINTTDLFGLENEFILGSTFRYDRNDVNTSWGSKGRLSRQDMGFFAQDTLHFTDRLALQLGGRYERFWLRDSGYNGATSRKNDEHAYDAALLFTPVEDLKTYVRFSRFFRAPFLDERNWNGPLLSPETGWMADVGADWTFLDEFNLGGNLYYSKLKNEIFYNPYYFGWYGSNMNSPADTVREGLNLHFGWEREKVAGVQLAYSLVKAQFDGGGFNDKEIPGVPEQTISLTGRVYLWEECFVFGGYRYQTEEWAISDFNNTGAYAGSKKYGRIPAYGVFHIGAEYAPEFVEWLKGFKFGFTVDNLFNKNYCDYVTYGTAYYPGAGRSYMFTVRYEF